MLLRGGLWQIWTSKYLTCNHYKVNLFAVFFNIFFFFLFQESVMSISSSTWRGLARKSEEKKGNEKTEIGCSESLLLSTFDISSILQEDRAAKVLLRKLNWCYVWQALKKSNSVDATNLTNHHHVIVREEATTSFSVLWKRDCVMTDILSSTTK